MRKIVHDRLMMLLYREQTHVLQKVAFGFQQPSHDSMAAADSRCQSFLFREHRQLEPYPSGAGAFSEIEMIDDTLILRMRGDR